MPERDPATSAGTSRGRGDLGDHSSSSEASRLAGPKDIPVPLQDTPGIRGEIIVSQSKLKAYEGCGEYFRRAYQEGEETGSGTAGIRGSAFHDAAAENHDQKIESRVDLPRRDLIEIADASFQSRAASEPIHFTDDERKDGERQSLFRARAVAREVTGIYADQVAPGIRPVLVEKMITAKITGSQIKIRGRLDLLDEDHVVQDLKSTTNGRRFTERAAGLDHQFTVYGMLVRAETGKFPSGYSMRIVNGETGKATEIKTYRTRRDIEVFVARLNNMIEAIRKGHYHAAEPGHWKCSPKWCAFWNSCKYVNAERTAAAQA